MSNTSIMIVGVGGQGTLLASRVLGAVAVSLGYDVKMSEVHGMAQRGGSVVTYVKFGEKVYSPIIEKSGADIILAFEELEAMRYVEYIKPEGKVILNTQKIDPMPVIIGAMDYPECIIGKIEKEVINFIPVDALAKAKKAGTVKAVNIVLIGVMAKTTDIDKEVWIKAIKKTVPERFLDMNLNAFNMGYNYSS